MARASWINDDTTPDLDAHVGQLEHFTQSPADGVIDDHELATQEQNLFDLDSKYADVLSEAEVVAHLSPHLSSTKEQRA